MKQGLRLLLPVKFEGIQTNNIEKIEFVFAQDVTVDNTIRKTALYGVDGDVLLDNDVFYIPWTEDETYLFKAGREFYMDTRITISGSAYQPPTGIVRLDMNPTLFTRRID